MKVIKISDWWINKLGWLILIIFLIWFYFDIRENINALEKEVEGLNVLIGNPHRDSYHRSESIFNKLNNIESQLDAIKVKIDDFEFNSFYQELSKKYDLTELVEELKRERLKNN